MVTISENTQNIAIEKCPVVGTFYTRSDAGNWLREHPEWDNDRIIAWWRTPNGRTGFASAAAIKLW